MLLGMLKNRDYHESLFLIEEALFYMETPKNRAKIEPLADDALTTALKLKRSENIVKFVSFHRA